MEDAFNVGQDVVDNANKINLSPKGKKKKMGMYMDY